MLVRLAIFAAAGGLLLAATNTPLFAQGTQPKAAAQRPIGDPRSAGSSLQDLRSLDELRETFNHDAGKIRLLLLLSPT